MSEWYFVRDGRREGAQLDGAQPVEVVARGQKGVLKAAGFDVDDVNYAIVTYSDGTVANFTVSYALPEKYPALGHATRFEMLGTEGVLIVDDLVDTGKTAKMVREMLPNAHFATIYAKPQGVPVIDTYVTEVSQDTWIYFPWDTGLSYQAPIQPGTSG